MEIVIRLDKGLQPVERAASSMISIWAPELPGDQERGLLLLSHKCGQQGECLPLDDLPQIDQLEKVPLRQENGPRQRLRGDIGGIADVRARFCPAFQYPEVLEDLDCLRIDDLPTPNALASSASVGIRSWGLYRPEAMRSLM